MCSVGSGQRWWAPGSWVCSGHLANNVNVVTHSTPMEAMYAPTTHAMETPTTTGMAQDCWTICCIMERMLG